jgi:class 3 adenylate cyclase
MGLGRAEELRGRHFSAMRAALAVHRGVEVKTLGDGVMAAFDGAGDSLGCAVTLRLLLRATCGSDERSTRAARRELLLGRAESARRIRRISRRNCSHSASGAGFE